VAEVGAVSRSRRYHGRDDRFLIYIVQIALSPSLIHCCESLGSIFLQCSRITDCIIPEMTCLSRFGKRPTDDETMGQNGFVNERLDYDRKISRMRVSEYPMLKGKLLDYLYRLRKSDIV